MSAPGPAHLLLIGVLVGGTAPAGAADDGACPASRGSARAADSATVTLRLTLRWRAGEPALATSTAAAVNAANTTSTQASARPSSTPGAGAVGTSPSTTTVSTSAHRLPDPVELSTVNGQALSWSQTLLHNEVTWQAVWTAQGQGVVGGERPVAVVDQAWFCPRWPGGSSAVVVDFRISSDPLPAGADAAEVPRGWSRHGRVLAPLGAWVPLSPQSGEPSEASRGERTVSAGRRVATDALGPVAPVLEMRWSLEAVQAARASAAGPPRGERPVLLPRPERLR